MKHRMKHRKECRMGASPRQSPDIVQIFPNGDPSFASADGLLDPAVDFQVLPLAEPVDFETLVLDRLPVA